MEFRRMRDRWLRQLMHAAVLLFGLFLSGMLQAQSSAGSLTFNHVTTGYVLDGAHLRQRCEDCHIQGQFRGTPRDCATCHRPGGRAPGKPASHLPTSAGCDTCHFTANWTPANFRHRAEQGVIIGNCASCHNGGAASGKPQNHIITTSACDSCHKTAAWTPAGYNHVRVQPGSCSTCHNGSRATGKSVGHIPTSASCDACHSAGIAFAPIMVGVAEMHNKMSGPSAPGNCSICHSGGFLGQNAQSKPATHIQTGDQCDTCHASTTSWATSSFNHATANPPVTGICSSCHGVSALGKPASHVPTAQQCDTCHTNFTTFKPAQMNHVGAAGQCSTCHSGAYTFANAQAKPLGHIPTTTQCDSCHVNGFITWSPAVMNHAGMAGKCSNCHSGGFMSQNAQTKPATHVATTAQCDSCHTSTTSWATKIFNHDALNPPAAGRCSSCHNSVNAIGKPSTHIPTSSQCDSCHYNFNAFKPARMNHAGLAGQCSTCHNGSYLYANALTRPITHIPTSAQCDSCHVSGFTSWSPATMNHSGLAGLCSACHSGAYLSQNAQTKPATHVGTAAQCDTCHRSTTSWATANFNHAAATPPVTGICSNCHNGTQALGKPSTHIPTTRQCDGCHTNFVAFKPATMSHTGTTGQCSTCHSGAYLYANALAKPATHVPTSVQCDTCHLSTVTWAGATYTHGAGAPGTCSSCHNGTSALGKNPTHIPTSLQCDNCHTNYVAFKPASMNHAGLSGLCSTCHNGSYVAVNALAKPAGTHIPTTAQCDVCHINGFVAFAPGTMNHAAVGAAVGSHTCLNCHNGTYVSQNAQAMTPTANHASATGVQCDNCHNSTSTWATGTFNHAAANPSVTGRCSSCHNGTNAIGKPTSHIPTAAQCDTCHSGFVAFAPALMNHGGTTGPAAAGNCATCHSGTYAAINAQAKPATHISTAQSCDTCHNTVAWKPTSFSHQGVTAGSCATCHGVTALGKPASHLPTTASCDVCHTNYTAFAPAAMNHSGTTGPLAARNCTTCHTGSYLGINAQVKPATHVATNPANQQCDDCHTSTTTWATRTYTHDATAVGRCANCHNGTTALGKPTTHIPTTAQCDVCHTNYSAFKPAQMNHAGTVGPVAAGGCSTCHGGGYVAVNALAKPASHVPTTAQCDTCHKNGFTAWAPATMNHTGTANQCSTCHSGAYLAQNAQIKPASHIVTAAQCDSCHTSTTTWATGTFNHSTATPAVTGRCSTCHTGLPYQGLGKPTTHIPTTAQCDVCHLNFTAFAPASMNHGGTAGPVAAGNCVTCHSGAYTAINAQVKTANHIPTTQSCDICHSTSVWKPTSFNHTGVTPGSCATCHDGVHAAGKPALHITPPAGQACDVCHRTGISWLPLLTPYSHTGVVAGSCSNCHGGSYPNIDVKPAGHLPTTAACDACHHSYTVWLPTTYNHAGVAAGTCQVCHGGAYANITVKPSNHIPTTSPAGAAGNECSLCHSSTTSFTVERMNHGAMQTSCATCHDSTSTYNTGTAQRINRSRHHSAGAKDCSSSGCHKPMGVYGRPYSAWN